MHLKTVLWERVMFKQTHTKKHAVFQANESGMEGDDEESTPSSKDSLIISPAESLSSPAHRLQGLNLLIKLLRLASPGHQVSLPGLSESDWLLGISLSFHLSLSLSFICLKWFCNSLYLSIILFHLCLSLTPENSDLQLSYFAKFVCCEVLDSNSFFVLFLRCILICHSYLYSCLMYWVLLCLSSGTDL